MKRKFLWICIAIVFGSGAGFSSVQAASLAEMLGLDKIAADAGANAAREMLAASRNIPLTTNQFGLIIDEYYSDEPAKRAKARRIVNNVFPDLAKESSPKLDFAVSLDFNHIDTTKTPLTADIWFIDAANVEIAKKLVNDGVRYKGEIVTSKAVTAPSTLESVSQKIKRLTEIAYGMYKPVPPEKDPETTKCGLYFNMSGQVTAEGIAHAKCTAEFRRDAMQKAILALSESEIDLAPIARITRAWKGGGFALILVPANQFDAQPQLDLFLRFNVAGDPTKTAKDFETPFHVSSALMKANSPLASKDPLYPSFRWTIVDLRVADYLVGG